MQPANNCVSEHTFGSYTDTSIMHNIPIHEIVENKLVVPKKLVRPPPIADPRSPGER
jgi:hypothetical protein